MGMGQSLNYRIVLLVFFLYSSCILLVFFLYSSCILLVLVLVLLLVLDLSFFFVFNVVVWWCGGVVVCERHQPTNQT